MHYTVSILEIEYIAVAASVQSFL